MAWDKLTAADKAWLAGIFEGEGSISLYSGSGTTPKYLRLVWYNNDLSMLREVQRLIGGRLYERPLPRKEEWAQSYQLQEGKKREVQLFFSEIVPYFRTDYKRMQVNRAKETANENGGGY